MERTTEEKNRRLGLLSCSVQFHELLAALCFEILMFWHVLLIPWQIFFFPRVNIEFNFDLIVCQMFCIWLWELFFYDFAHNAVLEEVFICHSDSLPVVSHCHFSAACLPSQLQFFIVTVHTAYNLFADCDFPDSMNMVVLAYSLSLIALFSNFYYHSYLAKKKSKKT